MEEGISVALRQWVSGHSPAYDWLNVKKCYWNRSEVRLVSGWGLKIALVSFLSRFSVVARGDVWYEKYLWGIVLLRAREHQRRSGDAEWQQQLRGNWTQPPPPSPLQGPYTENVILVVDEAVSLTLKTGVLWGNGYLYTVAAGSRRVTPSAATPANYGTSVISRGKHSVRRTLLNVDCPIWKCKKCGHNYRYCIV